MKPPRQINPLDRLYLNYALAQDKAQRAYNGNIARLQKDYKILAESDKYFLAFYWAKRNGNQGAIMHLNSEVLAELTTEKLERKEKQNDKQPTR